MLKAVVPCLLALSWSQLYSTLPCTALQCGDSMLMVEIAATSSSRAQGLMYRKKLATDQGMLFIFDKPQQLSFWMRNTYVPLSVAYIDAQGIIQEIYDLEPLNESPVTSRSRSLLYAIETPKGWWQEHQCPVGTTIKELLPTNVKSLPLTTAP